MHRRLAHVLFGLVLLTACQASSTGLPVSPREVDAERLTLHAQWLRGQIRVGEVDTLAISLTNNTDVDLTLEFPTGCQILPYVEDDQDVMIHPKGGWGCTTVVSSLTVPARGSVTRVFPVRGGVPMQSIYPHAPLAVGSYVGYARLSESSLRSNNATLTVVP